MESISNRTVFSPAQLYILDVMSRVQTESELDEIKNLLSKYFANKALDEIDNLWDRGVLNEGTIESWSHEHMRTPYTQA